MRLNFRLNTLASFAMGASPTTTRRPQVLASASTCYVVMGISATDTTKNRSIGQLRRINQSLCSQGKSYTTSTPNEHTLLSLTFLVRWHRNDAITSTYTEVSTTDVATHGPRCVFHCRCCVIWLLEPGSSKSLSVGLCVATCCHLGGAHCRLDLVVAEIRFTIVLRLLYAQLDAGT